MSRNAAVTCNKYSDILNHLMYLPQEPISDQKTQAKLQLENDSHRKFTQENNSFRKEDTDSLGCSSLFELHPFKKMNIGFQKFDRFLNRSFRKFGHKVATHTGYFIIVPILLGLLAATGYQQVKYEDDPEYLFAPTNGPAKDERDLFDHFFPTNDSKDFDPSRLTNYGRFVRFIISARDGNSIMRQDVWNDIVGLDAWIQKMEIIDERRTYNFQSLCAIWNGECVQNKILNIYGMLPEILNGSLELSYPLTLNPNNFDIYFISIYFGGVDYDEFDGTVKDVKAVTLFYWLKSHTPGDNEKARLWEQEMLRTFNEDDFPNIIPSRLTSETLEDELELNTLSVIPYFGVTLVIMVLFCVATLLMSDWVRAKPLLGIIGILSAIFACVTAFGFLMYIGVPFIGINLAAPFLMLGIGIDDMFVMLAAWRRTKIQDSVAKRLSETYAEAAVSITITTITDMISFFIGAITPFPSVQIFCVYTGTAVVMTYFWHVTFFGACMAIAGKSEANQKHSLFCVTVKPKSQAERENSRWYTFWCAGGISKQDPWNARDNRPHSVMLFFRDHVATMLNKTIAKVIVLFLFFAYISGAIYGCMNIMEGLERRRLSRYDSYSVDYYDVEDNYFREYPYRIQVMITGDLNYSSQETKDHILDLHRAYENQTFIAGSLYTESWMRGWYEFMENNRRYLNINISDETSFIYHLRDLYLSGEENVDRLDVNFNENYTKIISSRFIIQTYRILDSNDDKAMMMDVRRIATDSPLNVTVYHPHFIFFDQFMLVRNVSIQTVCLAAVIMMVVSLIFIPNPWCSLWVAFSIVSIELGVIGYMTFWGVNLDTISMINLIMCIGFSVDFSAHISYAYLTAKEETSAGRVKECLYSLGFPILQGAVSTILGVVVLVFAPSYIFLTFFKTVFLVIIFGALHGIFLLPVLLSLLGPGSLSRVRSTESVSSAISKDDPSCTDYNLTKTASSVEDEKNSDKDLGLGTSGEDSSGNSLSKATGSIAAPKNSYMDQFSSKYYTNCGFIKDDSEMRDSNYHTGSFVLSAESARIPRVSPSKRHHDKRKAPRSASKFIT